METQAKEATDRRQVAADRLTELGVDFHHSCGANTLEQKVVEAEAALEKGPTGITGKEAEAIKAQVILEEETREGIRAERRIATARSEILAESEFLHIPIDLPENPTELDLARARKKLGIEKKQVRPSPETVGIEAGIRGYYRFTNREQEDANHTVGPGGKYVFDLIANQVHVLSDYHVKMWRRCAVVPEYQRVPTGTTPSKDTTGQLVEKCVRAGDKPRFIFEFLSEAPKDAPFGLVTDAKILKGLEL